MVKSWEKKLDRLDRPTSQRLHDAVRDIILDKLSEYDVRKMTGFNNRYRIRIGKIRIVFDANPHGNEIVAVDFR